MVVKKYSGHGYVDVECVLGTALFISFVSAGYGRSIHHHLMTYQTGNMTCVKCPPGTHVIKDCEEQFKPSECVSCPGGSFQMYSTAARSCEHCDHVCHDVNMIVLENCSNTTNLKCSCKEGFYLVYEAFTDTSTCNRLVPCKHGEITVKNGTSTSQFQCSSCEEGEFYNSSRQCQTCTSCGELGLKERLPCTATADARCDDLSPDIPGDLSPDIPDDLNPDLPDDEKGSSATLHVVLGTSAGVVVIVVVILVVVVVRRRLKRRRGRDNHNSIVFQREDHKDQDHPLLPQKPHLQSTEMTKRDKIERSLSESSTYSSTSYCTGITGPELWTTEVFTILSQRLSTNWRTFVRNLPGPQEWIFNVDVICDHSEMENKIVQEQIYQALKKWQEHCSENISVRDIVSTLSTIGGCDLIIDLVKEFVRKINKTDRKRLRSL